MIKVLITSGGTSEKIDGVRTITNMSTGKLGAEICNNISNIKDIEIYFLSSNKCILPTLKHNINIIETTDTDSVLNNMKEIIENNKIDFVIHSMAISDYKVDKVFNEDNILDVLSKYIDNKEDLKDLTNKIVNEIQGVDNTKKISSNVDNLFIKLTKTPKIVDLIKQWDKDIKLISFKLLNGVSEDELISVATKQLERTNSDLVIANDLVHIKNGNHRALFISKDNIKVVEGKPNIAIEIHNYLIK